MQQISGNKITLTKGDTFSAKVSILKKKTKEVYEPSDGDEVLFSLKESFSESDPILISKIIPNDTMILRLEADETKQLHVGSYVFDVQITMADGTVDTFIDKGIFTITEEVG